MNPIHLVKGKLLDAQPGFVDTFNWLVDCFKNIKGDGDKIKVSWPTQTTPMISHGYDSDSETDDPPPEPIQPLPPFDHSGLGGNVTVVGTDSSEAVGKKIIFASESDSNMTLKVSNDSNGNVIVMVGAYYR